MEDLGEVVPLTAVDQTPEDLEGVYTAQRWVVEGRGTVEVAPAGSDSLEEEAVL